MLLICESVAIIAPPERLRSIHSFIIQMNVLLIVSFFILSASLVFADDDKPVARLPRFTDSGTVLLNAKAQSLLGLQEITLAAVSHQAEFLAHGVAVNIQPLLDLRRRYLLALTEQGSATARFNQAEQSIARQQELYRVGATSKRNLQVQQAQWQTDKSQLDASGVQGKAIIDEARISWGDKLTDLALAKDSSLLNTFLSGQKTLLQITLPANKQLGNAVQLIEIEASGNRSNAIKAELISAALHVDNTAQGASYFFQTVDRGIPTVNSDNSLRTGMRVAAWIPEQGENQPGVVIPKSAVIWYLDQAFVYIKTSAEQFSRRTIDQFSATTGGYFVSNRVHAGEFLVITGGQMLLSEEFKGQIPNEDD